MKKKMINHLLKKSFITIFAVCVLSTSICVAAFAEEDSTLEESVAIDEFAPVAEIDEEVAPSLEPNDNVVWLCELEDYIEETNEVAEVPTNNTNETYSEYPYTIYIRYLYTSDDGISYSDFSASQLSSATASVKSNEWGFLESPVSIKSMGDDYSFAGLIMEGVFYSLSFSSFEMVFDNYIYDGKEITVVYNYNAPQQVEQKNPDYPYTIHFRYAYTTDIYDTENLNELSSNQLADTVSSANANEWGLFENPVSFKTDMGDGFTYVGLIIENIFYSTSVSKFDILYDSFPYDGQVITVLYHKTVESKDPITPTEPIVDPVIPSEPIVDPVVPSEPIEDPVVPSEPIEDPVVPSEPAVDPIIPTEPVTPAPVVPEVPVAPMIIVEYTPIVEETESFFPMVEETEIVAAPAYVLPTLLKTDKEIIVDIPDEEIPLANIELNKTKTPIGHIYTDPHLCNILSFLLLLALAFVVYCYTQMAEKHDERIYELILGNKR